MLSLLAVTSAVALRLGDNRGGVVQNRWINYRKVCTVRCCDDPKQRSSDINCDPDGNCDIPSTKSTAEDDRLRLKMDLLKLGAACM